MIETGRVCIKIAGREAGKLAVIADILDKNYVLIDGLVRRKKCNISHLMPMATMIKIKKNASTEEIIKALIDAKLINEAPKKGKPKEKKEKPIKQHIARAKEAEKPAKEVKEKKEEAKEEKPKKTEEKSKTNAKTSKPKSAEKKKESKTLKKEAKPKKK